MIMSFRYHSIRTNHNVVSWIKDAKKFNINILTHFNFWPLFGNTENFPNVLYHVEADKNIEITSLNEHCCTLIRMSLTDVPVLPILVSTDAYNSLSPNSINKELNTISGGTNTRSLFLAFLDVTDDVCQIVTLWIRYTESESEEYFVMKQILKLCIFNFATWI